MRKKPNQNIKDSNISARIVIVSGSPGTGKTTISRILAENATYDRAVHLHTDDFYQYIRKGYIDPWLNGSGDQNETMIESVAASAKRFAAGGYEVFVDGVIGPWFITPWLEIAKSGVDVRYIILRPDEQTTVSRVTNRQQNDYFPLNNDVVKNLWRSLSDLGIYESHVVDTTAKTVDESVTIIQRMLLDDNFRII